MTISRFSRSKGELIFFVVLLRYNFIINIAIADLRLRIELNFKIEVIF